MRRVAAFSVGLMVIGGLASAPPAVASGSPDLVISQVYGGGGLTGAPYTNDFVELFNRGASAASLTGMSLQYGSATGNIGSTAPVTLSGTLQPGQRYLVQLVAGAVTAAPLPTPDATGSTNMSNSAGKVALVNATTALLCGATANPCTSGQLAAVVDLVGYGAANFYEGSGPTAAPNATTAAFRGSAGCNDTDDNASDFAVDIPWPRNTAAPLMSCTDSRPSVTSSTPVGATDVASDTDMSVTFSEAVTLDPDWFT